MEFTNLVFINSLDIHTYKLSLRTYVLYTEKENIPISQVLIFSRRQQYQTLNRNNNITIFQKFKKASNNHTPFECV